MKVDAEIAADRVQRLGAPRIERTPMLMVNVGLMGRFYQLVFSGVGASVGEAAHKVTKRVMRLLDERPGRAVATDTILSDRDHVLRAVTELHR